MSGWDTSDIPDQTGRCFIVTGANSGLGAASARALAGAGAEVILACRNLEKAERVAAEIGARAQARKLDLADLASVREFAASVDRVDVLMNNAGVMAVPRKRTADGFEMQFGTNHLGHFALTGLLLDKITDRVVTVSSWAHRFGRIDLDDPNWERRRYDRWLAYGQSKVANLLFKAELQRRFAAARSPRLATAAHPGYAATELGTHTESFFGAIVSLGDRLIAQSAEKGALPQLFAATADAEPGGFYGPEGIGGLRGAPVRCGSSAAARDERVARELWELSEKLTGVTYRMPKS
ncbi:oxidoreductase [Nocardia goodfellowii]|uniref:NAD(P)-dependent dehydrogenase (Short-subunit alcohol dehydrogenase family) n=1 Tax=Nocardia goodfellowii TaxID=882446 RepID=A0ABS4Q7C3_9NOCA|nr:oxidoreductase [Nocardia goodfellowii]MBP2187596.1 NAD(P)-dependent dehydrogenase (short-subunit alcohol dehydrogenase family) [Nocardia goodfellowii]